MIYKVLILEFILIISGAKLGISQVIKYDFAGNREVFGGRGELLEYHILDGAGNYRIGPRAVKYTYTYDTIGFLLENRNYGIDGNLCEDIDGVAIRKYTWNIDRNQVIISHYNRGNVRVRDAESGASILLQKRDSIDRVIEMRFFDTDSLPMNGKEGSHMIRYSYQEGSVNEQHFDVHGDLVRVIDEESKYLMGLQLYHKSIPKWLRDAKQINLVDGVTTRAFEYKLVVDQSKFDGELKFKVSIMTGKVQNLSLIESNNVDDITARKFRQALCRARFISLSNMPLRDVSGTIEIVFGPLDSFSP